MSALKQDDFFRLQRTLVGFECEICHRKYVVLSNDHEKRRWATLPQSFAIVAITAPIVSNSASVPFRC